MTVLRAGDEDLTLTLDDGESIILESGRYLLVEQPGEYFFGSGTFINSRENREQPFRGMYSPLKITRDTVEQGSGKVFCWRDDTSAVVFHRGDYVEITRKSGTGLYILGRPEPITIDHIVGVNVEKMSWKETHHNISILMLTAPIWVPLSAYTTVLLLRGMFGLDRKSR